MAVAMFGAGSLSDAFGRKRVMAASLAAAIAPNWPALIALRALTGLALSGVPAVAMAYLAEEMDRSAVGLAMGLTISGNTVGGLTGRLAAAAIAEAAGWRLSLAAIGAISAVSAIAFAFALPRERRAAPRAALVGLWAAIRMHMEKRFSACASSIWNRLWFA